MKNTINLFIAFLIAVTFGCKKESYISKFDKSPNERIAEQVTMVKALLVSAENGWIATLPTGAGGGFGFYINFDKEGYVDMIADLTYQTAVTVKKSQYHVKADMGTNLVFDTYTYISLLNDPDKIAFGGANRDGFKSDIEFIYDHSNGDSLIFIGKRYRQFLSLVKASKEQKNQYLNGALLSTIKDVKKFFIKNYAPYINIGALKVNLGVNLSSRVDDGKRITFSATYPNDSSASNIAKYAFLVNQIPILDSGLKFNGITFIKMNWNSANELALYDKIGKEYIIKNTLIPLYTLWGVNYNGMYAEHRVINQGTSNAGAAILTRYYNNTSNLYNFNRLTLSLNWDVPNKKLYLIGRHYQNSNYWETKADFDYTVDANGIYTFTSQTGLYDGYSKPALTEIYNFFLNNQIKFEYYAGDEEGYAQVVSTTNPSIAMSFSLVQ